MSVRFVYVDIPDRAYVNKWFDIRLTVHAEDTVKNMGIAMCYIGTGEMYVRIAGGAEEYSIPRCDTTVRVFYYPKEHSRCTNKDFPLQLRYTEAGSASLFIYAGYADEERRIFTNTDMRRKTIAFASPAIPIPIEARDLVVLVPMIAVPTGIGVVTKRTGIGLGIGVAAAGAYIGYKIYKQYRA
jgi:hypothetical protein